MTCGCVIGGPGMEHIAELFAHTADGAWVVDPEQRVVFWSQAATQLLGYSSEEAVGQLCHDLLAGRDASGAPCCQAGCPILARVEQGKREAHRTLQVRHRDRHVCWIDVSLIGVPGEDSGTGPSMLVHLFRRVAEGAAWSPPLRIRLLGPITVQRADGTLVAGPFWRRAKVRALLACLALHRGHALHRDHLLETVWPELDREAALHNLNTTVYYLRHSLEPALEHGADSRYVSCEEDRYLLSGGQAHWLDVEALRSGCACAQRASDPRQAVRLYREALALYRGDLLEDLDPNILWYWPERERLRDCYLSATEELGTLLAARRQEAEATALYAKALSIDPTRESATQSLMRLATRHGDRATAATHYRRLEEALWRELQIRPSQESYELYEMALQNA